MDFSQPDIERLAEEQPVGLGMIVTAVLIGGTAIGAAAAKAGWVEEYELPDNQPLHEEMLQFAFANVALVMGAKAMMDVVKDMGRTEFLKTMGYYGAGLFAFKLVVDGIRKVREK